MRYIPMLVLLLATDALMAQSVEPTPGAAAPASEAPLLGDYRTTLNVRIDSPYHTGVKVTRLWDAFNNCVNQDGTEIQTLANDFSLGVTAKTGGTCRWELSRMHWKLEFLPPGSVSGFAEIGIEQVEGVPDHPNYYNFCNPRGTGANPKVVCRTGRQSGSETIVVSVDRPPREVKTTLHLDYKGRAGGVKLTPWYGDGEFADCVLRDATHIEQTSNSSVELKVRVRGDGPCGTFRASPFMGWRVDTISREAVQSYTQITAQYLQKPDESFVSCRAFTMAGLPYYPREDSDVVCPRDSFLMKEGIQLTVR